MSNDQEKIAAARASMAFVREGDIVGLGSGSTASYAIKFLAERVQAGLKIRGIPTSANTKTLAEKLGIPLTSLDEFQEIDVDIDGADEIDSQLHLIKGGGGALLREKVIASAARKLIISSLRTPASRFLCSANSRCRWKLSRSHKRWWRRKFLPWEHP
jgi:ribose 5-phosphate isomerase A